MAVVACHNGYDAKHQDQEPYGKIVARRGSASHYSNLSAIWQRLPHMVEVVLGKRFYLCDIRQSVAKVYLHTVVCLIVHSANWSN